MQKLNDLGITNSDQFFPSWLRSRLLCIMALGASVGGFMVAWVFVPTQMHDRRHVPNTSG